MLTDYTDETEVHQYLPQTVTTAHGRVLPLFDADGRIISANLPSVVPGAYIQQEDYHGDKEIFACLDVPLTVGSYEVRPPCLGVWSLLESFKCPFVMEFGNGMDIIHCFRALYINEHRESIAKDVYKWVYGGKDEFDIKDDTTWAEFDEDVLRWAGSLPFDLNDSELWWEIRMFFDLSFNGYAMIPPGGGGSSFLFGAEAMGSVIASLGNSFNVPVRELIWGVPMILLGHSTAASAKANGVKGVSRPKSKADIRKQLILAAARDFKGELHPWQINEPLKRCLNANQQKHPKLVKQFERLRQQAAKAAGIQLNKVT